MASSPEWFRDVHSSHPVCTNRPVCAHLLPSRSGSSQAIHSLAEGVAVPSKAGDEISSADNSDAF